MQRGLTIGAALTAALVAISCGGGGGSTPTSPSPSAGGGGGSSVVTITITGKNGTLAFDPNPATVPAGQVVVYKNNDVVTHHIMLDDGSAQTILRCWSCKVALYSHYTWPEISFVRAGTLDEPASIAPDVHIFTKSKLPWVSLPDGVPAFDIYYDRRTLWPPASLERMDALIARRSR